MKKAYDIHLHASPSIFERWGDAEQTAEACQAAGMSGIVFKAHHGSTVELATHLDRKFEIDIFGGVVLNRFVGGLNPYAVDACCALGGKFVWLPTIHAAAHTPLGRFEFQEPKTQKIPDKGIRITEANDLVGSMYEILELLHNKKRVLATGHVSAEEIHALTRVVKRQAYNVKILVNHVHFFSPALEEKDIDTLKRENTWFEISWLTHKIKAAPIERFARMIRHHPNANWVMVSDSGQKTNRSPQALQEFRDLLAGQGISAKQIDEMMIHSPKALLAESS